MRNAILTFLTPGLILLGVLTVSCKKEVSPLEPGSLAGQKGGSPSLEVQNGKMSMDDRDRDRENYAILCARDYDPQNSIIDWDSLDYARYGRVFPDEGCEINLRVEFVPYPGVQTHHLISFEIPENAVSNDTTLMICTPDPGYAILSPSAMGNHHCSDPFILSSPATITFEVRGVDVETVTNLDVKLLRWDREQSRWVLATEGYASLRGGAIVGTLETTVLTRYAVGVQVH
jgi:hypothetical protein